MRYFLGIDVGATKTHALIADENGCCLAFGRAGGGNRQSVGYEGLVNAMQTALQQAANAAQICLQQITGAGFGIGGYDFPSERSDHMRAISKLNMHCPVELVNDGELGLLGGTTSGVGVNVTAGTSVNCRGRGPNGEEGRIVGNGISFGEFGGAYEIAWKGLHSVNYSWIKRNLPTELTGIYLQATGAVNEMDLMEGLSNQRYHIEPSIALQILQVAAAGDLAAQAVIRWAGEELGWLAVAVIRQISMEAEYLEVVQSGSLFHGGKMLSDPMEQIVLQHAPRAQFIRFAHPPVAGAVFLGMIQAGITPGIGIRQEVFDSINKYLPSKGSQSK